MLAKLGDGADLVGGKGAGHGGLARHDLRDDVGVAGNSGKADAQGRQGITSRGHGSGADVEDALQRAVHDLDNAEHDQEVDEHGSTAGHGVVAEVLLQLHDLFILLFGLILVLFLDVRDHRLECRHPDGVFLLVELEGGLHDVDEQGEEDDVPAVVGDQLVDPLHHITEWHAEDV